MHKKFCSFNLILLTICLIFQSFFINYSFAKNFEPVVQIDDVVIIGNNENVDVDSFLGIPFAKAPVGELRWIEPKPYKFSEKFFYAKNFAPGCMQGPRIVNWYKRLIIHFGGDDGSFEDPVFSEDCLYLNIWRPKSFEESELMPVIVYIHGGSNKAGWSYEPNYHGHNIAEQGAILVSIPYRLGVFGFLVHEDLDERNLALLDLISALEWIKKNILLFGGNPNNITLVGESAGANNINFLMTSPLSKGLFHKVIHQSGGSSISYPSDISYELRLGKKFEEVITNGKEVKNFKEYLKNLSSEEILNAENLVYAEHYFDPVVDGKVLTSSLKDSINKGNIHSVDLLIGSNKDEWSLYFDGVADVEGWLGDEVTKQEANQLRSLLIDIKNPIRKLDLLITAKNYVCPSLKLADEIRKKNKHSWVYSFERVRSSEKALEFGAFHGAELPYVFDTHDEWLPTDQNDQKLTKIMMSYWVQFAKFGNPNSIHSPIWKPFSKIYETQILDSTIVNAPHPSKKICEIISPLNY